MWEGSEGKNVGKGQRARTWGGWVRGQGRGRGHSSGGVNKDRGGVRRHKEVPQDMGGVIVHDENRNWGVVRGKDQRAG